MSAQVLSWQRVKQLPAPVWLLLWGNFFVRGSYFMVWPFLAVILYQRYDLSATETGFWLTSAAHALQALLLIMPPGSPVFYPGFSLPALLLCRVGSSTLAVL